MGQLPMCVEMNAIIQCLFFSSIRHNHVICWRNKKIDTYIQDMIDAYFQTETVDFCCDSCGCGQASATQTFKRLPRFGIILEHKHNICCYEGVNKSKLIMMLCEGLRGNVERLHWSRSFLIFRRWSHQSFIQSKSLFCWEISLFVMDIWQQWLSKYILLLHNCMFYQFIIIIPTKKYQGFYYSLINTVM